MSLVSCRAQITEKKIIKPQTDISFPEVSGLESKDVQGQINQQIQEVVNNLIQQQFRVFPELPLAEMIGKFQVTVNKNCILSIRFENFAIFEKAAHGQTLVDAITIDIRNGKVFNLKDLFKPGSLFRVRINKIIEQQIKERQLPLIAKFPGITDFQGFYLTDSALVIFFPAVEFTPSFVGVPEFSIPFANLTDLIRGEGPVAMLLAKNRSK